MLTFELPRECFYIPCFFNQLLITTKYRILQNTKDGPEPILPSYFLPFLERAAIIRNPHLINPYPRHPRYLGRYFRLKPKAFFLQVNLPDDGRAEYFIPCFHIGQVEVGKQVA